MIYTDHQSHPDEGSAAPQSAVFPVGWQDQRTHIVFRHKVSMVEMIYTDHQSHPDEGSAAPQSAVFPVGWASQSAAGTGAPQSSNLACGCGGMASAPQSLEASGAGVTSALQSAAPASALASQSTAAGA